jgi:hypothetical protein
MAENPTLYLSLLLFVASVGVWLFGDVFRPKAEDSEDEALAARYGDHEEKRYGTALAMGMSAFVFVQSGGLKLLFD